MLYKLSPGAGTIGKLEPLPSLDAADLKQRENKLEDLLASHLLDVLLEDTPLIAIFQERQLMGEASLYAVEADLYALNRAGDLVIFELKRGVTREDEVLQAIGYAQRAGRWVFSDLRRRYEICLEKKRQTRLDLREAHRDAFQLEHPLDESNFNQRQHVYIVGSVGSSRVDLQACKLEYSIVSPK